LKRCLGRLRRIRRKRRLVRGHAQLTGDDDQPREHQAEDDELERGQIDDAEPEEHAPEEEREADPAGGDGDAAVHAAQHPPTRREQGGE
jgi:hypothetical protein